MVSDRALPTLDEDVRYQFENDVKMYGTQAVSIMVYCNHEFEDDIKYMVLRPEPVCQTVYLV